MSNPTREEIQNILDAISVDLTPEAKKQLAQEVFEDLQKPELTLSHEGVEFTLVKHTKRTTTIQGVKFSPHATDVFDCCLGYLINQKNHEKMQAAGVDLEALKVRYELMHGWLKSKNQKYLHALEKEFEKSRGR